MGQGVVNCHYCYKHAPVQTEIVFYFIPEHVTVGGTGRRHAERRQLFER
jgi:hypothetical protein